MKLLRNLPIRRKMLVMSLLICGAVLVVATVVLFAYQVFNFKSSFQRDTATLAEIIANNSTAALAFQDENWASEVVSSLKAKPGVLSATLILPDKTPFAHYGQAESKENISEFPPERNFRYIQGNLLYSQPVVLKGDRLGALLLRLDFQRTFYELLWFYSLVVFGTIIASITLALFLSRRLGRVITEPVLELSHTAERVGAEKNYALRAAIHTPGDELGRLTESFNEMLSRIQHQDAELSLSQQKMAALIHSIDGIVWERAADSFQFKFISRQSVDILGYTPEAWLDNPGFWQEKLHPQDAAKTIEAAQTLSRERDHYSLDYRMIAADGRQVWIRESGTVLKENGQTIALRGIFQDITQHKRDAEELDKLNRQLVETSRHAGMAEVATGVLHNVGNVLNSVSVSATVVCERLRQSEVGDLKLAAGMLRDKNGELAQFLTSDPKGKLLPEFFIAVSDQLATERDELVAEMSSVGQHIEHIKEIVAMQQSYAKVSGAYEQLPAAELVEDALHINAAALDRHQIAVTREYAENLPPLCVDRHKVLQILINLLRNAKHAMDGLEEQSKRLVIRIHQSAPDRVQITISDNGIGIAPENLKKIFNHGFTTKKGGHGFGLHSGANAAKEMGGSLSGHSDGPGKGAQFILEVPTGSTARNQAAQPAD